MKAFVFGAALVTGLFFGSAGPSLAQQKQPAEIDPAASEVLKHVAEFFKAQANASVEMDVRITQEVPGLGKREQQGKFSLKFAKPNLLRLEVLASGDGQVQIISDGRTFWTYAPELKQFIAEDAPPSFDAIVRYQPLATRVLGELGLVAEVFRERPRETIENSVTSLKVLGREKVDWADCHKLVATAEDMDWTLWIDAGPKPLMHKYQFNPLKGIMATAAEDVKEKLKGARFAGVVTYSNWKVGEAFAPETFAFEPPKDARKVARFELPEDRGMAPAGSEAAMAMKGKPAPEFTATRLDGKPVNLADHKGKDVVVLDFWASWCGPCLQSLPEFGELAASLHGRPVAIYAVNLQEAPDDLKQFVAARKIKVPVVLDPDGAIAKSYGVGGIPHAVIIGKDGIITEVHVGFGPGQKAILTKGIEAALAK